MKKKKLFGTLLMAFAISMGLTSCSKDDEGSTGIMIRMRNADNGKTKLDLYGGDWIINSANNFELYWCPADQIGEPQIASVGKVGGLQKVLNVPSSGWVYEIAVEPRAGYVIKFKNEYTRLWVEDWIVSTTGDIIGAVVYYEEDWKP